MMVSNTTERLESYDVFDASVIEMAAETQSRLLSFPSYNDVFEYAGVTKPTLYEAPGHDPVSIVDILPNDCDHQSAIVTHLPFANGLDTNQLYLLAALAIQFPNRRIIAAGNPTSNRKNGGGLTREQRIAVASGDFTPTVEPLMRYIEDNKILEVDHTGYSLGAKKAVAAASMQVAAVSSLTAIEPVNVVDRNLAELGMQFAKTNTWLGAYVDVNSLMTFKEARKQAPSLLSYPIGLARLSNIAIARGLTDDRFFQDLHEAIIENRGIQATVVWGSASELCIDGIARDETYRIQNCVGDQLRTIRIKYGRHAMANDIALQNAVALTSIG